MKPECQSSALSRAATPLSTPPLSSWQQTHRRAPLHYDTDPLGAREQVLLRGGHSLNEYVITTRLVFNKLPLHHVKTELIKGTVDSKMNIILLFTHLKLFSVFCRRQKEIFGRIKQHWPPLTFNVWRQNYSKFILYFIKERVNGTRSNMEKTNAQEINA